MLVNLGELARRYVHLDADEIEALPRDVLSTYLAMQGDKLAALMGEVTDPD
jgi:hypothetical protein